MNRPFDRDRVVVIVRETLSRVLGVPVEEIEEHSRLVEDLGAESLDFVELNVTLEKTFGLALPAQGVLSHAGRAAGDAERFHHPRTGLTDEGAALLAASPYRYAGLRAGLSTYDIFNASTVANLANICHEILGHLPAACPDCGACAAVVGPSGRPACEACGATLKPQRGDEVIDRWVRQYLAMDCSADGR